MLRVRASVRSCPQRLLQHPAPTRRAAVLSRRCSVRVASTASPSLVETASPIITLTDNALKHLKKLKAESGNDELLLRVGVKEGGCSGMSYVMDFEAESNVGENDTVVPYDGGSFKLVMDAKSMLYLFGMELDYSSALINGGFKFENPNASKTCGCGKSFGVPGGPPAVEKADGAACN